MRGIAVTQKKRNLKDIKIVYKAGVKVSIDQLNELQDDLKELTDDAYLKLSTEITETGFAFIPHVWKNPKNKKKLAELKEELEMIADKISRIPSDPKAVKPKYEEGKNIKKFINNYVEKLHSKKSNLNH